jgi:FkbM family methyltransferase
MKSSSKKNIVIAIWIAIALIIVFTVVAVSDPIKTRAARLYLSGHSMVGFAESLEAGTLSMDQHRETERIHARTTLVERDAAGLSLWDTPRGRYWMAAQSRNALEVDLAEQERKIYGRGEKGERPGDIVLDCGANVGVYAQTALATGAKLVVAIEPAPENLECLRRNLARDIADGRVVVCPKGVWDKEDTLTLNRDPKNSARDSLFPLQGSSIDELQVPLTTIDKLVADLNLPRVDFIKMDIEGAERNAVLGARDTLRRYKPRMALCVYHRQGDETAIPREVLKIVPSYRVSMQGLMLKDSILAEVAHFQ